MAQGKLYSKSQLNQHRNRPVSSAVLKKRAAVKPGNRSIKPKKDAVVRSMNLQNKLRKGHLQQAELAAASKLAKPSGSTGLKFIS